MRSATIVPFVEEHVGGAAALLAERATRQRAAEPLLAMDDAGTALETLARDEHVSGRAAVRGGVVEAFTLARLDDHPLFGRNAWIGSAGYATTDAELLRDVYASAADEWFRGGYRRHYVNVPALPDELDPWYQLGFHHMHVQTALRETQAERPQPSGFSIREARPDDLEDMVRVDLLIFEHQRTPDRSRPRATSSHSSSCWRRCSRPTASSSWSSTRIGSPSTAREGHDRSRPRPSETASALRSRRSYGCTWGCLPRSP